MEKIKSNDIIFIINPNSGKKRADSLFKKIKNIDPDINAVITKNPEEAEKVFKNEIEKYKIFVIAGGDGTVNEAIKHFYNRRDKIFAVFPSGSGNGFARETGFKKNLNVFIEKIKEGKSTFADIIEINENIFINVAGLGFDGFIAHVFHKRKKRGFLSYVYLTAKAIFQFKPFEVEINFENKTIKEKVLTTIIANTRQFGNNAFIAPHARYNDGIADLAVIKPFPFYFYPVFILKMFFGTLKDSKYLHYFKTKDKITIKSDFKQYHTDGEPKIFKDKIEIKISGKKIRLAKMK